MLTIISTPNATLVKNGKRQLLVYSPRKVRVLELKTQSECRALSALTGMVITMTKKKEVILWTWPLKENSTKTAA